VNVAIRDWQQNERVEAFVVLRKIERKEFAGGERLALELGDQSGRIDGVMWEGIADVVDVVSAGDVVKVRGVVSSYRERPQLRVDRLRPATPQEADPTDFLPRSNAPAEVLESELDRVIGSLTNPHLHTLMERMLGEGELRQQYLAAAAGKLWHHNTIGGLVEHSLNIVRICEFAAQLYPELDRDLLVCGALLHDLGKVDQYEAKAMIDYTDEGRLVGHINTGDFRVATAINEIPGFPPETAMLLRHLIVSHQGQLEQGSPIVPMIMEAFVLHAADELDSKMGALRRVREKAGDAPWSEYVNLIGRYIYFGHMDKGAPSQDGQG